MRLENVFSPYEQTQAEHLMFRYCRRRGEWMLGDKQSFWDPLYSVISVNSRRILVYFIKFYLVLEFSTKCGSTKTFPLWELDENSRGN